MKNPNFQYQKYQDSLTQVSEITVSYYPRFSAQERPQISESVEAYNIFMKYWNAGSIEFKEEFKILLLNRANRVLGIFDVSSGGTFGTVVDLKIIFSTVLKCAASGIILAHNHPSGNLKPSNEDLRITQRIKDAGKMLDIEVLDHLIVSTTNFYSFSDDGAL